MDKFKEFLKNKGISEDDFAGKTAQEMGSLYNEFYQKELEAANKKAEANAAAIKAIPNLEEALKSYFKGEDAKKLQERLDEIDEHIKELKDNAGGPGKEKTGKYVDFVMKNIKGEGESSLDVEDRNYSAKMTIKAAELMTTVNVQPNVAGGFSPLFGNYIDKEIGHVPKADPFLMKLITVKHQPGTESIWYTDRINEEGDAEFIAEGALKPLVDAEWKTTKKSVKEVALRWKFTKRLMKHAPSVVDDFREHANELIENKMDDNLLTGDGTGNQLEGLFHLSGAFIVPPALANYYTNANIYDAIMAMATRVRLNNFKSNITAVLNTVWMAKMQGIKTPNGEYIIPPFVTKDGKQVGEVKVEFTNGIADTKIVVGDLTKFVAVIAEDIEYDEGYENDDFSKNLVSRKLEAFLGTYVKASNAGAIIDDDIATVLTAIAAPAA